jgi:methyl-accepting chemotaxis protein
MLRRRNYLIKKGFQIRFSGWFMLLLLLESALIAGLFMTISRNTITTGYTDSILTVETTRQFFFLPLLLISLIVVVGIGIIGLAVFVLLSHRIAGPLFRFEQALKQIEEGDLTLNMHLRKNDQLYEFKEGLNKLIDALNQRISHLKKTVHDIDELLTIGHDAETLTVIQDKVKHLKDELNHFRVTAQKKK